MNAKKLTQKDLSEAYERGYREGRASMLAPPKKRGRPKLIGEAAFERAWKRWGKTIVFIDEQLFNDARSRGALSRAFAAAADHFGDDVSKIETAWRTWSPGLYVPGQSDRDYDLVQKHCTKVEIQQWLDSEMNDWTYTGWRRLLRSAQRRARETTPKK